MPDLDSPDAARAFEFYCSRSAYLLGGIAGNGKKGDDGAAFWGDLVIRLAVTEPAVRHAVLALSSLHERACTPKNDRRIGSTSFAFSEYGKSIAAVRAWNITTTEPAAVPLLVCVLFICIEFLTSYESAAQLHILQGRHILSQLDTSNKSSAMSLIKDMLVPIYARLALSSFLFASKPEPIPVGLVGEGTGEVPLMFETMGEAKDWLFWLVDEGLRFTSKARPAVYNPETTLEDLQVFREGQQKVLSQFGRWNAAFTVLKAMQSPSARQAAGSKPVEDLLMVYYHVSIVWVSTALTSRELAYDDHMPAFAAIVSHASAVMASAPTVSPYGKTAFIFDTEMIPVLYWVATRCRHPLIRRAALRLLGRKMAQGRRENLWRGDNTYTAAKRVIELEEDVGLDVDMDMLNNYDFDSAATFYYTNMKHPYVPLNKPPTPPKPTYDICEDRPSLAEIGVGTSVSYVVTTTGEGTYESNRATPSSSDSIGASSPGGSSIADAVTTTSTALLLLPESGIDPARLEAPFGLPEDLRVKNTILGKRENGGIWVTTFRSPRPGEMAWDAKMEFLKFERP